MKEALHESHPAWPVIGYGGKLLFQMADIDLITFLKKEEMII